MYICDKYLISSNLCRHCAGFNSLVDTRGRNILFNRFTVDAAFSTGSTGAAALKLACIYLFE